MNKLSEKYFLFISSILLLMQLIFLYVVKYLNQDLSLNEFSITKIGNIFNLLVYVGIIIGIIVSFKKKKTGVSRKSVLIFILITWILLIIAYLTTEIKILSSNTYILLQPADKVLTGIMFVSYLFVLFYFLLLLWNKIISKNEITTLKNVYSTVLIMILCIIIIFISIINSSYSSKSWSINKDKNNIAIVLGAAVWTGNIPSPTLSSRVDKALDLLNKGFIGKIVFTGGSAPGELSEAETAYEYAKVKGIDTTLIVIEKLSSSTADQISWTKFVFLPKEKSIGDIIFVSDRYHLFRVIEISKFFNLKIKVAESLHKLDLKNKVYNTLRESIAIFNFWNFAL